MSPHPFPTSFVGTGKAYRIATHHVLASLCPYSMEKDMGLNLPAVNCDPLERNRSFWTLTTK